MRGRPTVPIHPDRIVWSAAPSGRGNDKTRPFVIATRRVDLLRGSPIIAIGCSTVFTLPLRLIEIPLPWDSDGRGITKLKEPTVVVCDWVECFEPGTRFETAGLVPSDLLRVIFETAGIVVPPER